MSVRDLLPWLFVAGCGDNLPKQADASVPDAMPSPPTCREEGLGGSERSDATAIDEQGEVAGWVANSPAFMHRAFRWSDSAGLVDLGTLGGDESEAAGIAGPFTVGRASVSPGDDRSFISDASGMHELPLRAVGGVNALGVAVGAILVDGAVHAAKYQGGVAIDLGTLSASPGSISQAFAINAQGEIVGRSDGEAVMWRDGNIISLGAGVATAIDASGDAAVGYDGDFAMLYRGGAAIPLDAPPGFQNYQVTGINDAGWIVGSAYRPPSGPEDAPRYEAFLNDGTSWVDLGMGVANAINSAGQIAFVTKDVFGNLRRAARLTCTR